MGAFFDTLVRSAEVWAKYPLQFGVALILGVLIGYFLSRLRHQGTIQALNVRISHKDDVIKLKDDAIASASASAPRSPADPTEMLKEKALPEPATIPPAGDPRFAEVNAKIMADIEKNLRTAILSTRYKLVFNPVTGKSKPLSFAANGHVAEGKNDNEFRWRIVGGRLEFLNSSNQIYSRFFLLPDGRSLHHTNDPDPISIKGQFLQPIS
jgi:hypothetical protein